MKILFWQWNAFMQKGMENALKKLNIEYDVLYKVPSDWESDTEFENQLSKKISTGKYDRVLSVNYCPVVSKVCEKHKVFYVSWVYDSPIHIRDISSFHNSCNRIYFFDGGQAEYYKKKGYKNIFHLPLAVDEQVWKKASDYSSDDIAKYTCDVAFVGKLYESDYDYLLSPLPLYERGEMEGIINFQSRLYGAYILDQMIDDDRMARLNQFYRKASGNKFTVSKAEMEYACACEVTGRERRMALTLLASRCNLHVHSGSDCSVIPGVQSCGYVDYYSQMPAVYANARINLNISLKTIRTGIPLRVLDVLSCKGFLITNYQPELLTYFEPDVDLVIYDDARDLISKTMYYLNHDELRKRIAENGQRKVRELFGFDKKIGELLFF